MTSLDTTRFSESFWTSDHMTGIRSLFQQLERGHSEGLATLHFFEQYTAIVDTEAEMFGQLSQSHKKFIDGNWNSQDDNKIAQKFIEKAGQKNIGSLKSVMSGQARYATEATITQQRLSSRFSSDLVMTLKDFLEDYSNFTAAAKKNLQNQYNVYVRSIQHAQGMERKITSKIRTLEDLGSNHDSKNKDMIIMEASDNVEVQVTPPTGEPVSPEREEIAPETPPKDNVVSTDAVTEQESDSEDDSFQFPLTLGSTTVANVEELRDILFAMIQHIPIKRRMIPLPGVNNEYFSSESFSNWVRQQFAKEDTRRKVEKFGQNMVELGLMANWNKLGSSLFVSDGGYYEFTDLARFTSKFDPSKSLKEEAKTNVEVVESATRTPAKASPSTPAKSNRRSVVPSSDIWTNLRSTFTGTTNVETLKEEIGMLQTKYVDAVVSSNLERTTLDTIFEQVCDKSQTFESNRITLIFTLHKLFTESVLADHQTRANNLTKVLEGFKFNEETVKYEQVRKIADGGAGWYWPKTEARLIDHSKRNSLAILDVDLVNQTTDAGDSDFKTKSVPVFVKSMIAHFEEVESVGRLWEEDMDIQKANEIKRGVIEYIGEHTDDEEPLSTITRLVTGLFEKETPAGLMSFFKLYLLELPDSVVPFTSYDALVRAYEKNEDKEQIMNLLGSMPRQNLSTLIFLSSHVSKKCTVGDDLVKSHRVPFYHLLLRPSPKRLASSIVDSVALESLVYDLLEESFQEELHKKLVQLEEFHDEREKRVQDSLSRLKQEREKVSSSPSPRTKDPNLTAEGLRTFRTKSPVPTPITSPKVGRSRTNSNLSPASSVAPKLKRPSDNLSKRNSLLADPQ